MAERHSILALCCAPAVSDRFRPMQPDELRRLRTGDRLRDRLGNTVTVQRVFFDAVKIAGSEVRTVINAETCCQWQAVSHS